MVGLPIVVPGGEVQGGGYHGYLRWARSLPYDDYSRFDRVTHETRS